LTKQQASAETNPVTDQEKQDRDLLLRRFELMDEFVANLRRENMKAGVDEDKGVMKQFIPWSDDFVQRKIKYQGWLDACTNPNRGNSFYTISDLKRAEKIPLDMISEHEEKIYPYRRLDALYKVKDKGKLYLLRHETWFGLDLAGEEKSISVNDLDYWVKPSVKYEYIPKDPALPDGQKIRVGSIQNNKRLDPVGERQWLTPYSKEKVDEFLSYGNISEDESKAATALILSKDGHKTTVSYQDFVSDEDFDNVYKHSRDPAPAFKVDKDFMKRLGSAGNEDPNVSAAPYK
jgi:hypothetical protein